MEHLIGYDEWLDEGNPHYGRTSRIYGRVTSKKQKAELGVAPFSISNTKEWQILVERIRNNPVGSPVRINAEIAFDMLLARR